MAEDFLCSLVNKVNELTNSVNSMQQNAGLYTDSAFESTLTGRIKKLEETVIAPESGESNISRLQVDTNLPVINGKVETTYAPIGDCVNREVMLQSPTDPDIWEPVGNVTFVDNVGDLGTLDYDGWWATVSYIYAMKITVENLEFTNAVEELVKDMYQYTGTVYRIIYTIEPTGTVTLKWEDNANPTDFVEEDIVTTHVRIVDDEEFNSSLYLSGTASVTIEVRNRLG
jgi:hypothetical protein